MSGNNSYTDQGVDPSGPPRAPAVGLNGYDGTVKVSDEIANFGKSSEGSGYTAEELKQIGLAKNYGNGKFGYFSGKDGNIWQDYSGIVNAFQSWGQKNAEQDAASKKTSILSNSEPGRAQTILTGAGVDPNQTLLGANIIGQPLPSGDPLRKKPVY